MEYIFELTQTGVEILSYVEVYHDVWIVHMCSCVDCDSFFVQYFLVQMTG